MPTGKQLKPFIWTNPETEDFVRWLIEDVAGTEFANTLDGTGADTPTRTLGETLRDTIERHAILGLTQEWLDKVNWDEVAQYLIAHLE